METLAELRADLPITRKVAYFQIGSYAPVPLTTQHRMAELLTTENTEVIARGGKGWDSAYEEIAEEARRALAAFLGADPATLAWSYNTTTATRLAVASLGLRQGDRVAVTDVEHAGTLELVRGLAEDPGIQVTTVPTGDGRDYRPEEVLDRLDRLLTPDHRLLLMTHVANTDGRRLPVLEAVRIARERGVPSLVDGAQAAGAIPVDVGSIGADFYVGSCHKWLMGPPGIAFLVVGRERLSVCNPYHIPSDVTRRPGSAAARLEIGTANNVLRLGAAHSLGLLQSIGFDVVFDQMRRLSERLRTALATLPGVEDAGPGSWERSSGITTIRVGERTPDELKALVVWLRDRHQIVAKHRPEARGVRVSLAAFNTDDEVDRLVEALAEADRR